MPRLIVMFFVVLLVPGLCFAEIWRDCSGIIEYVGTDGKSHVVHFEKFRTTNPTTTLV